MKRTKGGAVAIGIGADGESVRSDHYAVVLHQQGRVGRSLGDDLSLGVFPGPLLLLTHRRSLGGQLGQRETAFAVQHAQIDGQLQAGAHGDGGTGIHAGGSQHLHSGGVGFTAIHRGGSLFSGGDDKAGQQYG